MSRESWKIGEANKSRTYILPMLGFKDHQFFSNSEMPQCQFRNCFIGDNNTKDKILLLYAFSNTMLYATFVEKLKKHELFETLYQFDYNHTVFVFSVPEEFKADYYKILSGNYSSISQDYKDHIIRFHSLDTDSDTFGILYRTGHRREKLEERINFGLPKFQWTRIPPFIELEEAFDEIEVLKQEESKLNNEIK